MGCNGSPDDSVRSSFVINDPAVIIIIDSIVYTFIMKRYIEE